MWHGSKEGNTFCAFLLENRRKSVTFFQGILNHACDVDDFCKQFEAEWQKILVEQDKQLIGSKRRKNRRSELSLSEAITITIMFHKTGYRTFKDYYTRLVASILKTYFLKVMSYSRFVNLMKTCLFPLFVFSQGCLGECTGISFVDSTILTVCHPRRIHSHRMFRKIAKRGKRLRGSFMDLNYI